MCICVGWLIFAMNFFTRKSMCILVPHTHLLFFCSSIFLHIGQSWSLFAHLLFSNLFAHLLVFKLFAHLLFVIFHSLITLYVYTFPCSSISFAHELHIKLFAHVLQLFLIFFMLNNWVFSLLVHLRDSPPLSLCSFTKNVKKQLHISIEF